MVVNDQKAMRDLNDMILNTLKHQPQGKTPAKMTIDRFREVAPVINIQEEMESPFQRYLAHSTFRKVYKPPVQIEVPLRHHRQSPKPRR